MTAPVSQTFEASERGLSQPAAPPPATIVSPLARTLASLLRFYTIIQNYTQLYVIFFKKFRQPTKSNHCRNSHIKATPLSCGHFNKTPTLNKFKLTSQATSVKINCK
jgi:hypothetical protein